MNSNVKEIDQHFWKCTQQMESVSCLCVKDGAEIKQHIIVHSQLIWSIASDYQTACYKRSQNNDSCSVLVTAISDLHCTLTVWLGLGKHCGLA